jgi:CPA2 family monovalent cation:H+ antiporter-2
LLAPSSEFAFVGVGLAAASHLLPEKSASLALAAVSISMALTPLLALLGRHAAARLATTASLDSELMARPETEQPKVIVVGYGRVGRVVCSLFAEHQIPYIAVDRDAGSVSAERQQGGRQLFYGDATEEAFLRACGLDTATALIITIDANDTIDDIVRAARSLRPDLLIVARARDAIHAQHLYAVGATTAVPETVEASFQLSEAALVGVGIAPGLAIASIHERRERLRNDLKGAAERSGGDASRALRRPRGNG